MSSKKQSFAEKISQLINPTPFQDPEDDFLHEETAARVVDPFGEESSDEAAEPVVNRVSDLRLKNAEVLEDGRYAGQKVSRKSLEQSSDETSDEGSEEDLAEELDFEREVKQAEGPDVSEDEMSDEDESGPDNEQESEDDGSGGDEGSDNDDVSGDEGDMFPDEEGPEDDEKPFQHFSSRDRDAEVEKGQAVRNQLNMWDGLLEIRIQLQKCLIAANQLPTNEKYPTFKSEGGKEFASTQLQCKQKVSNLMDSLLKLQDELLKRNPETRSALKQNQPTTKEALDSDEEIPSSDEGGSSDQEQSPKEPGPPRKKRRKLTELSKQLISRHKEFLPFRNATIQKWNDKTRVAQGKISSKNFSAFEQSTVQQIEHVLTDRQRLLKRTRLKRSAYRILGESEKTAENADEAQDNQQEVNSEIFDDDDFYHQLLRELIEHKSESVTDPIQLGRQWIALQKLRSKMKRKIDTRATKGRKLRYVVHPKLVNFMAPYDKQTFTDESKNELFHSLFAS